MFLPVQVLRIEVLHQLKDGGGEVDRNSEI